MSTVYHHFDNQFECCKVQTEREHQGIDHSIVKIAIIRKIHAQFIIIACYYFTQVYIKYNFNTIYMYIHCNNNYTSTCTCIYCYNMIQVGDSP